MVGRGNDGHTEGQFGAVPTSDGAACVELQPSLTFSLGFALAPQDWSGLSLAVGLALAESLHPSLQLKWPNDLWLQGRKLGGILIETASLGELRYAVVGIGLNITPRSGQGLRTPPAALSEVLPGVNAPTALARLVPPLVSAVQRFESDGFGPFGAAFHARDVLYGKEILCNDGTTGFARGVDTAGALLVHTKNGLKKSPAQKLACARPHLHKRNDTMLRLLFLTLILANGAYFVESRHAAFIRFRSNIQHEPQRMEQQIKPEAFRVLTTAEFKRVEAQVQAGAGPQGMSASRTV